MQATNNLLRVWGAAPLRTKNGELGDEPGHRSRAAGIYASQRRSEFAVTSRSPILELTTPAQPEPRFVLLTSMRKSCRLLLTHEHECHLSCLQNIGLGSTPFGRLRKWGSALAVGSIGQQVKRLHTLLARSLGEPPSKRGPIPTTGTPELVARFQKSKRLSPDGVVGPQTMITLYNAITKYPRPTLRTGDTPAQDSRGTEAQVSGPTSQDDHGNQQRNLHEHHS